MKGLCESALSSTVSIVKSEAISRPRWSRQHVDFWDDAIKGSSALQAALRRELSHELAASAGVSSAI
eukprot:85189-Pyramimonas_sp.AAC.1